MKPRSYFAKKQRETRQRMRDRGFVIYQTWVHPDDLGELKALAVGLRNRREFVLTCHKR